MKLPDVVQILEQVCSNHVPWGLDGAAKEKTLFTCVYIGKNLLKSSSKPTSQFQSNFVQIIHS
jgi:hypothetical protein